ncbi:MAG: class I SAM-dependent methyltransferase [Anaerolineae bacterium]
MTDQVKSYFAGVAEEWDSLRAGYFSEALRAAAIARASLGPHETVADVGTGTGFMLAGLAPKVGRAYGLDNSPEMLAVAQRNLTAFDNVILRQAEGSALPLDANSIDAAFANMYLHHAPDPALAIREIARMLKPGGRLIITDLDSHDQTWMREAMADLWLGFEREQVARWFVDAGLIDVSVDCADQNCCSTSDAGQEVELSIFLAYGRKPES